MNAVAEVTRRPSVCPHDCPSVCALEVEVIGDQRIGRIHGARDQTYTSGVICAKVARYWERIHHPDRLTQPLRRVGPKGSGQFASISWEEALDRVGESFLSVERESGPEGVWPYFYAGTMGLVMRDGIERLTHAKRYSRFHGTICVGIAWPGYVAGAGRLMGADPREMAKSDCVVIWGTNAIATQVNVMSHAIRARKERGAKIVAVDIYETETMRQADLALCVRPGTDGALACAVMHVLFRDGLADWDYLERYTDAPYELDAHLRSRSPAWASAITGVSAAKIRGVRRAGRANETDLLPPWFRLLASTQWRRKHACGSLYSRRHRGLGARGRRRLPQQQRHIQASEDDDRGTGRPRFDYTPSGSVTRRRDTDRGGGGAERGRARSGDVDPEYQSAGRQSGSGEGPARISRDDLFTCVHEQFMTDTARYADIVLRASMFLEHDDIYTAGGHQHLQFAAKVIEPPDECRSNDEVIADLARRVGAEHPAFSMSPRDIIDWTLRESGYGDLAMLEAARWLDLQPPFEEAHFLDGFGFPDGKFRFKADWTGVPLANDGMRGPWRQMPKSARPLADK